jgi:hypothetical protein
MKGGDSTPMFSERHRAMAAVIGLFFAFEGLANPILAAAVGFEVAAAGQVGSLIARDAAAVELLRWGALLDLGGYLALGLVILYVGERLWQRDRLVVAALTLSGLAGILVGAVGAALLATVGPWLILDYGGGPPLVDREAQRFVLDTLGRGVVAGLWGVLVFLLLGAWLGGVGWLLLPTRPRVGALALIGGAGMLATGLRTAVTGRIIPEVTGFADLLIVLGIVAGLLAWFAWMVWLAVHLWTAPSASRG